MGVSGQRCCLVTSLVFIIVIFIGYWSANIRPVNTYHKWIQDIIFTDVEISPGTLARNTTFAENTTYKTTQKIDITTHQPHTLNIQTSTVESVGNRTLYITSNNFHVGRLGNQMFKYASLLGMARKQGRKMFIGPGSALEETFKLQYVNATIDVRNWKRFRESNPVSVDSKFLRLPLENVRIRGFLQSFHYFADVMDEVRQEFTFKDKIANDAAAILHDVQTKHRASMIVGVHVRRGDFLSFQQYGYGVPEKSYFMKAFSFVKSKYPKRNVTFLVASDDLAWCNANLIGNDVVAMPPASAAVHMAVLSRCEHGIISGGTFGWWSAFLAGGKVIYYAGYLKSGTHFGNQFVPKIYYPRLWIGMGN